MASNCLRNIKFPITFRERRNETGGKKRKHFQTKIFSSKHHPVRSNMWAYFSPDFSIDRFHGMCPKCNAHTWQRTWSYGTHVFLLGSCVNKIVGKCNSTVVNAMYVQWYKSKVKWIFQNSCWCCWHMVAMGLWNFFCFNWINYNFHRNTFFYSENNLKLFQFVHVERSMRTARNYTNEWFKTQMNEMHLLYSQISRTVCFRTIFLLSHYWTLFLWIQLVCLLREGSKFPVYVGWQVGCLLSCQLWPSTISICLLQINWWWLATMPISYRLAYQPQILFKGIRTSRFKWSWKQSTVEFLSQFPMITRFQKQRNKSIVLIRVYQRKVTVLLNFDFHTNFNWNFFIIIMNLLIFE